jgi:uncharacterized protein
LFIYRTGLFRNPERFLPQVKRALKWGLVTGVVADVTIFVVRAFSPKPVPGVFPPRAVFLQIVQHISLPALAAFYACAVILVCQSEKWKARLAPFAAVGRMALTNYLLQSALCTWFFHWTKLYGKVGPAWGFVPTVILFGAQIQFSVWWLKRYQFGPTEWLWRSLTYGKWQSMKRREEPPLEQSLAAANA